MGYQLTGDQFKKAMRKIGEIARQLGQGEYPYYPDGMLDALQDIVEGRFAKEVGIGPKFLFVSCVCGGSIIHDDKMEGRQAGKVECRYLLDHQNLIPVEYRGGNKNLVFMGWRRPGASHFVAYLFWNGDRWVQDWLNLENVCFGDLAVRIALEFGQMVIILTNRD
jgi:hypothetical protein